jgi:ElaB/YqjD/DUF883 family membrane-anchored ribosome-binding protein
MKPEQLEGAAGALAAHSKDAAAQAGAGAQSAVDSARGAYGTVAGQARDMGAQTMGMIKGQPLAAVIIAAAAGYLFGRLRG